MVFDRSEGFELLGTPPNDNRPRRVRDAIPETCPNPIGLTVVDLLTREGPHVRGHRHARRNADSRYQALSVKRRPGSVTPWLAEGEARRKDAAS